MITIIYKNKYKIFIKYKNFLYKIKDIMRKKHYKVAKDHDEK